MGLAPIPASAERLVNYVDHLAAEGKAPSSIERALAAVLSAHRLAGAARPDSKAARTAIKALRRLRRFMIERTDDTAQLSKFACQFSPAIEPGGFVRFGCSCLGGCFLEDYYWRQDITCPTRHVTITVRHRRSTLLGCSAVEQLQGGSETFATDEILWDQEGPDVTITVTRDYLAPGQALTLRWETDHGSRPA